MLDERLLGWLLREDTPAGQRQLTALHSRLKGRDLTLGEAREMVADWLDPEHGIGDETVLRFE
jgi:hypothetical protein